MLALDGDDRAEMIARMVRVVARERADNDDPDSWTRWESHGDYVTMLRSIEAWTEGPEWNRVVVAAPRMRPDGGYWTGTVAEVLDTAIDRVDTDAGDHYTYDHGQIEQDDDSYEARVVWNHKPNLERLSGSIFRPYPMISFTYDRRLFFLSGPNVHLPVYVANRHTYRHGVGGSQYAYHLRLFAKVLGVTLEDARRISEILVPDRCGLSHERNPAVHILSEDDEELIQSSRAQGCAECGARAYEACRVPGCQGEWV